MVYNKIYAQIGEERHIVLDPVNYQYDIKQILVIQGETVPDYYEADVCNAGDTATLTMIGTAADGVEIPDTFLQDGRNVLVYVVIPGSGGDVQTRYDITIPVDERAEREDIDPSEAEQQQIDSLINALNSGVARAEAAATAAEESATDAEGSAGESEDQAENAEAWAVGQRAGEDVPDTDPTYHNNSKYYAERAEEAAAEAGQHEASWESWARRAEDAADEAEASATRAGQEKADAEAAAQTATQKATAAGESATAAAGSAAEARQTVAGGVGAINTARDGALAAIGQAGTTQVNAVNQAGANQVAAVNQAGATQTQAVEDKGEEVIGSIPQDYSDLVDDVADLTRQLSDIEENQIPELKNALGLVISEFEFGDIYVENGQATYYDANNRIRTKNRNGVALDAGTTISLPSGFVFRVISLANGTYSYLTEWVNFTTIEISGVYYILARKIPTAVLDSVSEITSVLKIYTEDGYDNTIKTLENDIQKNFQKVNTLSVSNAKVYRVNTSSTEESPTGTRLRIILYVYDGFYVEAQSSAGSGLAVSLYETLDKALYAGSDYIKTFQYSYTHAVISGSSNVGGYLTVSAKKDDGSSFSDEEIQSFVNAINLSVDSKITKVVNDEINGEISFLNADMGTTLVAMSGYNTFLSGGSGTSTAYKKNLSFAVITDLHGSGGAFERFITYANENEQYLDFAICLGDIVPYAPWQDVQWYFNAIEKSKVPVYYVPGNHDIADTYSSAINQSEARTRYFSPIISRNWLTESNFQGAGKCSWYKDFADYGIRIISLFEYGNSQPIDNDAPPTYSRRWMDSSLLQWFADTLYGTPENFSVIVFLHQTPYDNIDYIQNKFTQTYRDVSLGFMNTIDGNPIEEIVDAFIHSGTISKTYNSIASYDLGKQATVSKDFSGRSQNGMFIGYICGHTHAAIVANAEAYTDQKIILVNTGSTSFYQRQWDDLNYDDNNRNKDCFYCIGIDKTAGNVNLTQIGGQTTLDMRKRDFDKVKFTT